MGTGKMLLALWFTKSIAWELSSIDAITATLLNMAMYYVIDSWNVKV